MEKIQRTLMAIILVCLCALAWASVFVRHNMLTSALFTAGIFIWLGALEPEQNN